MKRVCILFLILAFAAIAPVGAQAPARPGPAHGEDNAYYGWADVLRVDPVFAEAAPATPAQPCYEEQVPIESTGEASASDQRGIATAIGAVIGGLLGNQIGKGSGRAAATLAGAVAGGAVGNGLVAEDANDDYRPRYRTVRHCPPKPSSGTRRIVAYDVEYRYRGDVYSSRLAYDPGDRLRVRISVTPAE
jgi:uncharacterized protein YcfJ